MIASTLMPDNHNRRRVTIPAAEIESRLEEFADALAEFDAVLVSEDTLTLLMAAAERHPEPARDFENYPDSDYGHPANMT